MSFTSSRISSISVKRVHNVTKNVQHYKRDATVQLAPLEDFFGLQTPYLCGGRTSPVTAAHAVETWKRRHVHYDMSKSKTCAWVCEKMLMWLKKTAIHSWSLAQSVTFLQPTVTRSTDLMDSAPSVSFPSPSTSPISRPRPSTTIAKIGFVDGRHLASMAAVSVALSNLSIAMPICRAVP